MSKEIKSEKFKRYYGQGICNSLARTAFIDAYTDDVKELILVRKEFNALAHAFADHKDFDVIKRYLWGVKLTIKEICSACEQYYNPDLKDDCCPIRSGEITLPHIKKVEKDNHA